jgi:sigma-B regulation protein RsbQ
VGSAIRQLVLLPGMDGTGNLFDGFIEALPREFETKTVRFPPDAIHSYSELFQIVQSAIPESDPFVLLAESFSTPLAIQLAAAGPANLKALILCAGFVTPPVIGWKRAFAVPAARLFSRITPPASLIKMILVGRSAPSSLVEAVRAAISSVRSKVLVARVQSIVTCEARTDLARVKVPILYVQAAQDKVVSTRCMKEILSISPTTKAISVPGPHLIIQREPQKTAAVVAGFLHQLES